MKTQLPLKKMLCCSLLLVQLPALCSESPNNQNNGNKNKNKNNQQVAIKTVNQNESSSCSTLSASHELEKSIIQAPFVPTEKGLGAGRGFWEWTSGGAEELLYTELQNKKFQINNSSSHRKLSTAIEIFVDKKRDDRITDVFAMCRNENEYHHKLRIDDVPAIKAHQFLAAQNKSHQDALKTNLENSDKKTIIEQNASLVALKKSITQQITDMQNHLEKHMKTRDAEIKKEGDEIRRLKKGLHHCHKLNRKFQRPADLHCTDDETQDPEDVNIFYNDTYILEKIVMDKKIKDSAWKIEHTLEKLNQINKALQEIPEMRY